MSKPYVALLDDDLDFSRILKLVLERLGLELIAFSAVDEFMESVRQRNPDLCLIDLNLDEIGKGFEVVENYRASVSVETPIFIISGTGNLQSISHGMEVGANDFIIKPVDKELLAAKLHRYVQSQDLNDLVDEIVYEVPAEDHSAHLSCHLVIDEVDEFGVKMSGAHLVSKGTAIRVAGSVMEELTGISQSVLLNVASTWVSEDGKTHGCYAEFDPHNDELIANVRRWLTDKLS